MAYSDKYGYVATGAHRELAEGHVEHKRLKEQVSKASAAIAQLREQIAGGKEELAAQADEKAAAVAEKDGFANKVAEYHGLMVAAQHDLAKQRSVNEEVRNLVVCKQQRRAA